MAAETPDGTSAFHRFCFNVLPHLPGAVRGVFGGFRLLLRSAPEAAVRLAMARAAAADRALMADAVCRRQLAETFAAGLAGGSNGPVIDMTLFGRSWTLASGSIDGPLQVPARVWIGTADRNVPLPAARRLAKLMGAQIIEKPGSGHYWIAQEWQQVLAWMAQPEHPSVPRA